ncbi:MFS transporter [Sedimentitalea nanhaiensis]|uniref:BT1 family protein n=1 Tax=Sedimentitalea nanhaiensis TaxID=999627 RepID=A0A1I6ZZ06_9RHOB|nr:membrane protein [Sedimentitalea nanhaiensis]SFT67902.1 BT1 family protein [Sedimentitalea nanhaiensis]
MTAGATSIWFDRVVLDLGRQMRWSFLPPLMIYFSYGVSGLTAIVGTFFVKDYLGLSAAFLAGIAFWAGLPWALKMPLGHLVDLIWRFKSLLVYLGAGLIAASLLIMYFLITAPDWMAGLMPIAVWYVTSALLAPCGYVIQDAVADAMSVEAVPRYNHDGTPVPEADAKAMHTTMQTLGRFSLISGTVAVALLNIFMFSGAESLGQADKAAIYARIYLLALIIPLISISGVLLAALQRLRLRRRLEHIGKSATEVEIALGRSEEDVAPNHWYFTGGLVFVTLTVAIGLSDVAYAQEIVFAGSMAIVLFLMRQLIAALEPAKARALIGTAIIIFVFRAVPLPGQGATWFEIDILEFDEQFLSVLYLITSVLTLLGIILLRPMMANRPITSIVILLTVVAGVLSLPNIGLFYGLQNWTAAHTGGIVDARFIAIMDTAVESPLGQVAMIPMLAWIARNAPSHLKATFFAVMASFTNLALSASALATKYLNQVFTITREVRDRVTDAIQIPADYSQLGMLLITVAVLGVILPLAAVAVVQTSRLRTTD